MQFQIVSMAGLVPAIFVFIPSTIAAKIGGALRRFAPIKPKYFPIRANRRRFLG
ncbi:hypothetical protein [Bradyrhizobium sp. LB11.1]|uniref:hypothetical protein n=1 Tax=Bradyrhizobium sp. LB11.1 TaxID=3156326 RepID=UPI0033945CAE